MARNASDVRIIAEDVLTFDGPPNLLGKVVEGGGRSREDAVACYLSGGAGWHEAVKRLGGAFAKGATELRERKTTDLDVNQPVSESFQRPGVKRSASTND